jgi:hypothetical protein
MTDDRHTWDTIEYFHQKELIHEYQKRTAAECGSLVAASLAKLFMQKSELSRGEKKPDGEKTGVRGKSPPGSPLKRSITGKSPTGSPLKRSGTNAVAGLGAGLMGLLMGMGKKLDGDKESNM